MNSQPPDIEAVLTHYGADRIPPSRGSGWRSLRCPFHDDCHASASVNAEAFYCHSCGVKGDALAIIQQQESCSFPEAIKFAQQIDSDYDPAKSPSRGRRPGKRSTGRRWTPPGRRGRQTWA